MDGGVKESLLASPHSSPPSAPTPPSAPRDDASPESGRGRTSRGSAIVLGLTALLTALVVFWTPRAASPSGRVVRAGEGASPPVPSPTTFQPLQLERTAVPPPLIVPTGEAITEPSAETTTATSAAPADSPTEPPADSDTTAVPPVVTRPANETAPPVGRMSAAAKLNDVGAGKLPTMDAAALERCFLAAEANRGAPAHARPRVHLRGWGDSHARDLLQSPLLRAPGQRSLMEHQNHWSFDFPRVSVAAGRGGAATFTHHYEGTPAHVSPAEGRLVPRPPAGARRAGTAREFAAAAGGRTSRGGGGTAIQRRASASAWEVPGQPPADGTVQASAPPPPVPAHLLLSRGTWDTMKYATPLDRYADRVTEMLRSTMDGIVHNRRHGVDLGIRSVTFKVLHYFHEPEALLSFFGPCTGEDIVGLYRRVGACAVARFNRERQAATGAAVPNVTVLDAWDAARAWPRESKAMDGHHLVGHYLHAVADAWLRRSVCPSSSSADSAVPGIWMSADADAIESRFDCAALEEATPPPATSAGVGGPRTDAYGFHVFDPTLSGTLAPHLRLERSLVLPRFGERLACRCQTKNESFSDVCGLGRPVAASISGRTTFFYPPHTAAAVFDYLWHLAKAADAGERFRATPTTFDPWFVRGLAAGADAAHWRLTEIAAEACIDPSALLPCLRNNGYDPIFPPDHHPYAVAANARTADRGFADYRMLCTCLGGGSGNNGTAAPCNNRWQSGAKRGRSSTSRSNAAGEMAALLAEWRTLLAVVVRGADRPKTEPPLFVDVSSTKSMRAVKLVLLATCADEWRRRAGLKQRLKWLLAEKAQKKFERSMLVAEFRKALDAFYATMG